MIHHSFHYIYTGETSLIRWVVPVEGPIIRITLGNVVEKDLVRAEYEAFYWRNGSMREIYGPVPLVGIPLLPFRNQPNQPSPDLHNVTLPLI